MSLIYLDYNATTPLDPAVADTMRPFLSGLFGNPSSIHEEGVKARLAVETSRNQIASLLNCHPDEIIFTSGGSEANNFAIKGIAYAMRYKGNHIITSCIEHPAVTEVCKHLETEGFVVTYLPVNEYGQVSPEDVQRAITPSTILITIMHANNETGTIQPLHETGKIARKAGIIFHTDAAQSIGKIPVDVEELGVDLLSVAGHKFYAPKGVGALFIRRGVKPVKLIHGADHEQNLRAGTENVMSVAGLGKAAEVAKEHLQDMEKVRDLRDKLYEGIISELPEVKLNGPENRLPNTLNISFPGVEAPFLLSAMKGIAASAGAACHSGSEVVSPVLKAMGVSDEVAMGTIRFSLGRMTTEKEIEDAIPIVIEAYRQLKGDVRIETTAKGEKIKLTRYTHSLGCACKIDPLELSEILKMMPAVVNPDVLVGFETSDDAAVYRISDDTAIVQTVDLIPPVVDDPYDFGAVAAANAISDIYAMGAEPLFALSIVGFPKILPASVLNEILKGANDKVAEAGISIIGGHSIEDTEPKFGLVVTGIIHPDKILKNRGAKPGDFLILTKPLGSGIISTGVKRGIADKNSETAMIETMSRLNKTAASVIRKYTVNACTDVTGFGLLGHLKEMITGSSTGAVLSFSEIPVLPGTTGLITAGIIPGGTLNNLKSVRNDVVFEDSVPEFARILLADAQTSGGLLFAVPEAESEKIIHDLHNSGVNEAAIIGRIVSDPSDLIKII